VKNAQEEGEPDDPSKEYWFIQEEALYEHPYMEKKGKEELRQLEKEFNEKRKKRKKKGS
jgi:ABC-type glycerol-3-phosphate transport system substrate-binding protein